MKYSLFIIYLLLTIFTMVIGIKYLVDNFFYTFKDIFLIVGGIVFLFSYGLFTHGVQVVLVGPLSFKQKEVRKIIMFGGIGFLVALCVIFSGVVMKGHT